MGTIHYTCTVYITMYSFVIVYYLLTVVYCQTDIQENVSCFMKQFDRNITIQEGHLLRLSCPTNCPATWSWSHPTTLDRKDVQSDFDNPPYFYIMDVSVVHTGWYWCRVLEEGEVLETSLFVEVSADVKE